MSNISTTEAPPYAVLPATPATAAWPAVFSLALGVFGLVTAEFLPVSLLTPIAADIGISAGAAGQTVTATAVIAIFAGLGTAIVTRGIDRRLVIFALTLMLIVSTVLAATATNLPMLLAARLLLGIGLGGFWSMAAATAMRLVPAEQLPRAMAIIFTGVSFATVSAAPLGAYLGDLIGWRAVFGLAGLVGVVALAAQVATLPRLPAQSAPDLGTLAKLVRRGDVRVVMLATVIVISGHFAGFTYVRPFLEQVPALGVESISLVLLVFGIGGFFGNFAGSWLVARSAPLGLAVGASTVSASALALFVLGADPVVSALGVALWGFAFGMLPVAIQTWMVHVTSEDAESSGGLLVASFQAAIASGAVFGGLLVDHVGASGVIAYCGLATLVAAAVAALASRRPPIL
jgi:DHA1 family purine ribonucleoside efflux pump-like MFS transporter